MKTVHRIGLLLWKNLTLRKRHYVITTFEILLPTVFAILVVFGNNMIGRNNNEGSDPDDSPTSDFDQPAQFYEEFSQTVRFNNRNGVVNIFIQGWLGFCLLSFST